MNSSSERKSKKKAPHLPEKRNVKFRDPEALSFGPSSSQFPVGHPAAPAAANGDHLLQDLGLKPGRADGTSSWALRSR